MIDLRCLMLKRKVTDAIKNWVNVKEKNVL